MRTTLPILVLPLLGVGCGDWEEALLAHEQDADAHGPPPSDASDLTQGTLSAERIDPSVTAAIESNTAGIANNAAAIAQNTSAIGGNTTAIDANAAAIAGNTSDITLLADAIATNTSDIATHATSITANASDIATHATRIAANADDLAGRVSAAGDTMTGPLVVPEIVFDPPRVSFLSVPALAFLPERPDTELERFLSSSGNGGVLMTGGTLAAVAPVQLPHDALITDLDVLYYDGSTTAGLTVELLEISDAGSPDVIATFVSTEADAPFFASATVTGIDHTVDNHPGTMLALSWTMTDPGDLAAGPGLYVVTLTYRYVNP